MKQVDGEWLRKLAALADDGTVEIGMVELKPRGVIVGVFTPGTFAAKERESVTLEILRTKRQKLPKIKTTP